MIANISSQYENVKTISDKEVFITAKSEKKKKTNIESILQKSQNGYDS